MLCELIEIGEKLVISIDKENRSWGYNPADDGTVVILAGFGETFHGRNSGFVPGVYQNHHWIDVMLPGGEIITIGSHCVKPFDEQTYNERYQARCGTVREFRKTLAERRLRDLPDTPIWEGDIVSCEDYDRIMVQRINYDHIGTLRADGSEMPIYQISDTLKSGWYTWRENNTFTLLERGKIWKYYNDVPFEFESLEEEANFFIMLGATEEVRNPADKTYTWSHEQAIEAIKGGLAHGLSVSDSLFLTSARSIRLLKFDDEKLGARVAKETLAKLG